jgi:putative tricarboxylic transport membrane protein
MMTDRVVGVLGLVFALAYGIVGAGYKSRVATDPLGPGAFPALLAVLFGICSIALILKPGTAPGEGWPPREVAIKTLAGIVAMVAYGFLLEVLGFLISSFLLVAVLVWLLKGTLVQSIATGIVASALLFGIFDFAFGLPLPPPPGLGS